MKKAVIFTDLDGTLLDDAYNYSKVRPALNLIQRSDTPFILYSSKTRAEINVYRLGLKNSHPYIAENGGGIFIPHGYFKTPIDAEISEGDRVILLGQPYGTIREQFVRLRKQLNVTVRGFGDMSVSEVASLTGLSGGDAALAKQRDFDEPFVFDGPVEKRFLRAIEACGLTWTQGRIFHVMGNHDKGRALKILMTLYKRQFGDVSSIALGDGMNDLPMLIAADRPVLVKRQNYSVDARLTVPNLMTTKLPGPAGWNEAVTNLLGLQISEKHRDAADRNELLDIFNAALVAVDPYNAVLSAAHVTQNQLHVAGNDYNLAKYDRIVVVGAGKATARMALALESLLGYKINAGVIVVKQGHTVPLVYIHQVEASHPVPNDAGIAATRRILSMARDADERTLVIALVSGGASALLVAPVEAITLQDKRETTQLLLNAGATIFELNAVRKHLSMVKGGRLAQAVYPGELVTLILSDVIGDPLDVIASGPTSPDTSTFADAWAVIKKFGLQDRIPRRVAHYLQQGVAGVSVETVKESNPCLANTRNVMVASNRQALSAAEQRALLSGYATRIVTDQLQGDARDAARYLAKVAREELALMAPGDFRCLLCGGETTVTVHGDGKGGRNQELALYFALEIEGLNGVSLLSAGTDGNDGPTDAAGAIVDGSTVAEARRFALSPFEYLSRNDSYHFFQRLDAESGLRCHLKTGPTGTNVMDIQIVLLNKKEQASAQTD
ncbi:MAG: HAD-IIB family hydrolase [Gallionella sp.]